MTIRNQEANWLSSGINFVPAWIYWLTIGLPIGANRITVDLPFAGGLDCPLP